VLGVLASRIRGALTAESGQTAGSGVDSGGLACERARLELRAPRQGTRQNP
jgi:hypothetical protein